MALDTQITDDINTKLVNVNGLNISYSISGKNTFTDKKIILIHSLALNKRFWDEVIKALNPHVEILVYDCRGHGQSDKPPGPYNLHQFANDLSNLLDHLGWHNNLIAGADMGGAVAMRFAIDYPTKISLLGLIGTCAWYGPDASKNWNDRVAKVKEHGFLSMVEFQKKRWVSEDFIVKNTALMDQLTEVFLHNDIVGYTESCLMMGNIDLRKEISMIKVPTQILVGSDDQATPIKMAEELNQLIPNSTLEIIESAKHLASIEKPLAVARHLLNLMNIN